MAQDKSQSTYDEIVAGLGQALADFDVLHNQILTGIYMRPATTKGGIILTQKTQDEDKYQGKVGVVLKKGPLAFTDDPNTGTYFHGQDVQPGEWVIARIGDGTPIDINGIHCKMVEDVHLKGRVQDPTTIY